MSIVSSPFLANSKDPLVPHLLKDPRQSEHKKVKKPKRKVIINIINSDEAQNNHTLENILKLSQEQDSSKVNQGMTGVIQPLNGMNSRTLSNRYRRSSDNKDNRKSPDSDYEETSTNEANLLVNPTISDENRRSQKNRKVVINIINGGDETKMNETLENVIELSKELQLKEELKEVNGSDNDKELLEDTNAEKVSNTSVLESPEEPELSADKKRKVVINIINGGEKSSEKPLEKVEDISPAVIDKVNGSQRSSLDYDSFYFSPPEGQSGFDLNNFNYEDYQEYQEYPEEDQPLQAQVSPVDPSQLLIGFGGSQSTTRIPFLRKPVRGQNLQNMGHTSQVGIVREIF